MAATCCDPGRDAEPLAGDRSGPQSTTRSGTLQVLTGAVVAGPGKGYDIEKVLWTSFQGQTLNDGNFGNLYLLIEHALVWVESRFDTLCDDITEELERLPRETLLSQPELKYLTPEAKDVDSPRAHG